jgi:hypothetical protein
MNMYMYITNQYLNADLALEPSRIYVCTTFSLVSWHVQSKHINLEDLSIFKNTFQTLRHDRACVHWDSSNQFIGDSYCF